MRKEKVTSSIDYRLAAIFCTIAAVFVALGVLYYRYEAKSIQDDQYENISAIAKLKADSVYEWRRHRLADVRRVPGPLVRKETARLLKDPGNKDARAALQTQLNINRKGTVYADALFLDTDGAILLSDSPDPAPVDRVTIEAIEAAIKDRREVLSELFRDPKGLIYLDAVALIPDESGKPIAIAVLRSKAEDFLFPLIQSWPTPSKTAETILVRQDGDSILFLNELRHRSNTALTLRFPLANTTLPAVHAVLGGHGRFLGRDYRGIEVLAMLQPVPQSPWFIVAKVDAEEIMAEAVYRVRVVTVIVFLLILAAAGLFNGIYQNRQKAERMRTEEQIRSLNAELEQRVHDRTIQLEAANKELEAFCYSVSHDLRSPLRAVDGFSQALLEDCKDMVDDQGKEYLMRVRAASQRMAQLIDDLLKLSRISRADMRQETIDLSALVHATSQELRDENPDRSADLAIQEGVIVRGDPNLIKIAIANLLGNAYKFTRNNPHARIEFGTATHEGKEVCFVRDNGVGFDMKFADKLFGAFQRLHSKSEFEGTGIGLATVQRVIHRHGGKIWAEAENGKGATFYFSL